MDILKQHYEKLILLLLLLIFIGLMSYVLRIVEQSREIQEHHLQIPTREPDYETQDPNDAAFNIEKIFQDTSLKWENPRSASDSGVCTDLAYVFKIVKCPFCGKLIPRQYMEDQGVCPFCKNKDENEEAFAKPPAIVIIPIIPDEIRQKYNLASDDPDSDFYDMDGDGFSNIYEYMQQTDMGDPHSHPPLWHLLRVVEIGRITLPVELVAVDTMDSEDQKQWGIRVKIEGMTSIYMIGDELTIDGKNFTLESVERKSEAASEQKDAFAIILKEKSGEETLRLAMGEKLRSFSDNKAVLENVATKGTDTVTVGEPKPISVGNFRSGTVSYQVKEFNVTEGTVLLETSTPAGEGAKDSTLDETGTKMLVTGGGRIPPALLVKTPQRQGYPSYGNPSQGNPAGRRRGSRR